MLQTAARLLLLFSGGNGRYCSLAIVAKFGEGISDASHFLHAPTFGPALLLYVRAACFSSRRDLGQSCLAYVRKVCDMLLEASGNAEVSRFDVGAGFLTSSAQAPNCAIALDTGRNDKTAQTDKIFSI